MMFRTPLSTIGNAIFHISVSRLFILNYSDNVKRVYVDLLRRGGDIENIPFIFTSRMLILSKPTQLTKRINERNQTFIKGIPEGGKELIAMTDRHYLIKRYQQHLYLHFLASRMTERSTRK